MRLPPPGTGSASTAGSTMKLDAATSASRRANNIDHMFDDVGDKRDARKKRCP